MTGKEIINKNKNKNYTVLCSGAQMIPIVENDFYGDPFVAAKNNVITYISLNINGLKVEKQKAKNEML